MINNALYEIYNIVTRDRHRCKTHMKKGQIIYCSKLHYAISYPKDMTFKFFLAYLRISKHSQLEGPQHPAMPAGHGCPATIRRRMHGAGTIAALTELCAEL